ncbi:BUB1 [[Candida] subhashii]|uniref:BUB1 n=1 Tax=[Candida] subhashii TaxID=561895 RepID=A0A8J5QSV4_9ASCO|nr:BUB1 [[Candida] subhashii]KAG7666039.1 BUB1 [[Candida] subhashii]
MLSHSSGESRNSSTGSSIPANASSISSSAVLLEQHKENIQPLPQGRLASKLSDGFKAATQATSLHSHKLRLQQEREQFEMHLNSVDELDDPLQIFVDYINWIHYNYPQGANVDSGLVLLLERCTSSLRDIPSYKNDARYLKVWLEYANYSDCPRDIYVYLAKKEIGNQLALYYESFGNYLELNNKLNDANQIYQLGIQSNARRNRSNVSRILLKVRSNLRPLHTIQANSQQVVRDVLAIKSGTGIIRSREQEEQEDQQDQRRKKQKLDVFKDTDQDQNQSVLYSIFGNYTKDEDLQLGSTKRCSSSSSSTSKINVFRDSGSPPTPPQDEIITKVNVEYDDKQMAYTKIEVTGKKTEKVMVNMDLVYQSDNEYTFEEILALSRRHTIQNKYTPKEKGLKLQPRIIEEEEPQDQELREIQDQNTQTLVIPVQGIDDTIGADHIPREPTMTMYSKMADNEVAFMYRGGTAESDDEELLAPVPEETNYDEFVTETLTIPGIKQEQPIESHLDTKITPPTDQEQDYTNTSSPFIDHSPEKATSSQLVNPFDNSLKSELLDNLPIPLSAFSGYHDRSSQPPIHRMKKFRDITAAKTKKINRGSQQAIIDYCGDEIYCLIHELGQGGYGYVYLIENGSDGTLKALKIESPSSKWEFYILHIIHRRLVNQRQLSSRFIHADSLFYFRDESFLILDYYSQSTLLDVVNYYKTLENQNIPEVLCVYLTLGWQQDWNDQYMPNDPAWAKKSISLIDFGRGIDLSLFPKHTRFITKNMKVDEQDCVEMNEGLPWTYEADYYGLAGIVHTLLFGTYIKVQKSSMGHVSLRATFKRYWQTELWSALFEMLLNPYEVGTTVHEPKMEELRRHSLYKLLTNHVLRSFVLNFTIIQNLETGLNSINKKRLI